MTLHSLQEEFVDAMRSYTATVNVISAQHSGKKQAMTATSVASLSLDPPSMLISVNKEASIHNILGKNRAFCINVLSPTQIDLAELCSNEEEEERFEKGNWGSYKDIPYNEDSVINIFCNCFDCGKDTGFWIVSTSCNIIFRRSVKESQNRECGLLFIHGSKRTVAPAV